MNCPACKHPLIVLDAESVEVDYCVQCKGVWLDAGELELIFEDEGACRAFMERGVPASSSEKPRKCPECDTRMKKEQVGGDRPIVYDHCPNGDGIWFDHGELGTVLEQGGGNLDGKVAAFLRNVFHKPAESES